MGFVGFPNFPLLEGPGRDWLAPIPAECHGRALAFFPWIGQRLLSPARCGIPTSRPGSFAMSSSPGLPVPDRKSTRLNSQSLRHLVCRLLLEKKNITND